MDFCSRLPVCAGRLTGRATPFPFVDALPNNGIDRLLKSGRGFVVGHGEETDCFSGEGPPLFPQSLRLLVAISHTRPANARSHLL